MIIRSLSLAGLLCLAAGPAAAFDWDGFYGGVTVGYTTSSADVEFTTAPASLVTHPGIDSSGWGLGVQLGYNVATGGGLILGLEGDLSWSDISETIDDPLGVPDATSTSTVDFSGMLRGRLGFDGGEFMPFLTGGVIWANATDESSALPEAETQLLTGWTLGAGVEMAVASNVTLKAEYFYASFGETTFYEGEDWESVMTAMSHTVRLGANFHF